MHAFIKLQNMESLIKKLEEYIEFLNKANESPINIASAHGWKCSQQDVEKGQRLRDEIESIKFYL